MIEMEAVDGFLTSKNEYGTRDPPPPPPGPPPPTPPRTPKARSRAEAYGYSSASSMTPGGTPVPPTAPSSPDAIEEPSKLVSKLLALPHSEVPVVEMRQ